MSEKITRVRDVMRKEAPCIDGMATCTDAARIMREEKLTCLLVNKRTPEDAWGIVTSGALVTEVLMPGRQAADVSVYEIMIKPVISVPADMDIRFALDLLRQTGIRSAPVEHEGTLVGMVNIDSLVLDSDLL